MKCTYLLLAAAPFAIAVQASAQTPTDLPITSKKADAATAKPDASDVVTTGVARGRDRLDSSISTSALKDSEIFKLAPRSVSEILRDIPGLRSEAAGGEGSSSISVRGLPIASSGAKFLQLQEDGLPVLEFGDIAFATTDQFLRADLNLAQVEVVRGGSASTFASNSPGGLINFISKTGDVEGGTVQLSAGLDYDEYRGDFEYGGKISDTLRFHVGGFYRQGEGPRRVGYDALKGGQIKLNVTKDFSGGYIRIYGKYLNDRAPLYYTSPTRVTGTNDDPKFGNLPNYSANKDLLMSRYFTNNVVLDGQNNLIDSDVRDGQRSLVKAVGFETQFNVSDWLVSERFRYADNSGHFIGPLSDRIAPAALLVASLAGPGATASYASGPNAGKPITDLAGLNGNGLLSPILLADTVLNNLNTVTNDIRISRVWKIGTGDLTTTAGLYNSRQTINADWLWGSVIMDLRGDGQAALVNLTTVTGVPVTQNGAYGFGPTFFGGLLRRDYRVHYDISAPFGSVNYRIGRLAIGGSLRYDYGRVKGQIFGAELGDGRVGTITRDMNGDGIISSAERRVSAVPLSRPAPVDYDYDYLSYSSGINFRVSDPLAVFARYSRGSRANADRLLFTPVVSTTDGSLRLKKSAADYVRQAEAGVKYRKSDLTLNLTGFWAETQESNIDNLTAALISRIYRAKGLEFEGGYRIGMFSLNGGATYTHAEIAKDNLNPQLVGNTPRHQAKFIFQATPQITTERFAVGAVFIGTTDSYSQDVNVLKLPGFVTTNAFVQFRPVERLLLSVNANNLFDVLALTGTDNPSIPATGVVGAFPLNGRTISASARFEF